MSLRDAITGYFVNHPRAKKMLGVATAVAANFAMVGTGSAILAVAAGTIVKTREDQQRVNSDQLVDFFKEAIQDPSIRDSLKEAVQEGGIEVAAPVTIAMNQLGAAAPETGQFVDTMKSELTIVLQNLGLLQEMLSYYEIPDSRNRIVNVWRLPNYMDDVLVIEEALKAVIDSAVKLAKEGENVVILGAPGSGKTTAMYAIWKDLNEENDTALVWDTKDATTTHQKDGVILFNDDLPETKELAKAIVEKDIRGIVTTAREQDWSRLPVNLRSKFNPINLPNISDEVMTEITKNHLNSQGVPYAKSVLSEIVKSAQGSPIYVRYLVEEICTEIKSGAISKLSANRVKQAPKGMTDYVAGILARVLFELDGTIYRPREGALPVIKTILCLADMPNYETHEVHLNQMFFALKQPSDSPGPFNAFKQYLSRDPRFFSLKFMHDTLADVLRGKVDHPVVGDIRMVAQEMGVSGRRKIESQALDEGWSHVKEEYEIDNSGGLEPILAYSYFAARNFSLDRIDPIALNLANQHLENPISQGLFAITGPITEIPQEGEPESHKEEVATAASTIPVKEPTTESSLGKSIEGLIKEKIAGVQSVNPEDLEKLKSLGSIGEMIGSAIAEDQKPSKTSIELLEELLAQENVSPRLLSRAIRKAARRINVRSETGKLRDKKAKGKIIVHGAERLVLLDSMSYLEILNPISQAMANTLGEKDTANTITRITRKIMVSELDDKSLEMIAGAYDTGTKRSAKFGNYEGMIAYLINKWKLIGFDTSDLTYISKEFGKIMRGGRTAFALDSLNQLITYFSVEEIEVKIGLTLQAFKNLTKAVVYDRNDFNTTVDSSSNLFEKLIASIEECGEKICVEILRGPTISELCTTAISSTVSLMDSYVNNAGKAVSAESVYPLIHEAIQPFVLLVMDVLNKNGSKKSLQSSILTIAKMKGESSAKKSMVARGNSLM
ncbi:MAG: type IV secretion system DNA-binding domain-containing protein [Candidatus Thorarchaeota archaeon]